MLPEKRPVKITFVTGHDYPPVTGFDFGNFAILVLYDLLRGSGGFKAYYEKEYQYYSGALSYETRYMQKKVEQFSFDVSEAVIAKVYNAFEKCDTLPASDLFSLLESFTPRDILPRFFVER